MVRRISRPWGLSTRHSMRARSPRPHGDSRTISRFDIFDRQSDATDGARGGTSDSDVPAPACVPLRTNRIRPASSSSKVEHRFRIGCCGFDSRLKLRLKRGSVQTLARPCWATVGPAATTAHGRSRRQPRSTATWSAAPSDSGRMALRRPEAPHLACNDDIGAQISLRPCRPLQNDSRRVAPLPPSQFGDVRESHVAGPRRQLSRGTPLGSRITARERFAGNPRNGEIS